MGLQAPDRNFTVMSGSNEKNNDMLQKTSSEVSMAAQEFPEWEVSGAMKRSDVARLGVISWGAEQCFQPCLPLGFSFAQFESCTRREVLSSCITQWLLGLRLLSLHLGGHINTICLALPVRHGL